MNTPVKVAAFLVAVAAVFGATLLILSLIHI